MIENSIASVLIAAHFIADFALQPDFLVQRKSKPSYQFLHAIIHAMVAFLLVQQWSAWQLPIAVLVVHFLIDFCKDRYKHDTATVFFIDQIIHVFALLLLVMTAVSFDLLQPFNGIGYQFIIVSAGFIATTKGAGYMIAKFANRLKEENKLELKGIKDGGKFIGELERTLIFVLIIIGEPMAIGFLVAAKSILRFQEAKDQQLAEYVLIGTLLSFSLAIGLASATVWAMAIPH